MPHRFTGAERALAAVFALLAENAGLALAAGLGLVTSRVRIANELLLIRRVRQDGDDTRADANGLGKRRSTQIHSLDDVP